MRFVIVLAIPMLLGGCWWEGPMFYPPNPAAIGPLSDGSYVAEGKDGETKFRVGHAPDGSYVDDDGGRLVATPFDAGPRSIWIIEMLSDRPADDTVYGLVERHGDALYADIPACEDTKNIVRAAGGRIEGSSKSLGGLTCEFDTREQLESAIRAYLASHPRLPNRIQVRREAN